VDNFPDYLLDARHSARTAGSLHVSLI
jgi:hypothetical protein